MTDDNDDEKDWDDGNKRVRDEEGSVDEKVKRRILNSRERIDDTEFLLYVQTPAERRIDQQTQVEGYGMAVRQYIRSILPLLNSDDVVNAGRYRENVELANFEVPPPPGSENWTLLSRPDVNPRAHSDTLPPSVKPPEPKRFAIKGLENLLAYERIHFEWFVNLSPHGAPNENATEHLVVDEPIPKSVYDAAVKHADLFLQEIGIGVDVGFQEIDDQDDNPF